MIPHSRPTLGEEEKRACSAVLESLQIAQGKRVEEFEKRMAALAGRRYAVAVSSGTAALQLSLFALGISKSDEIIMPSYSCAALLHPVMALGAKPVFADIEVDDFNISARETSAKIRKRTKAVIVPHLFGRAADTAQLERLGLAVIEDGTQALGASAGKGKVGSLGLMSIFSFYATKMITTGEGGMILTDSKKLADTLQDIRDYDKKQTFRIRTNSKMTDLEAAIGLEQLAKLPLFIEKRRAIARRYDKIFQASRVLAPVGNGVRDHVYFRYVARVPAKGAEKWLKALNGAGIEAKTPIYKPLHRYFKIPDSFFPVTAKAMKEAVSLPIYPAMTDADFNRVKNILELKLREAQSRNYVEIS